MTSNKLPRYALFRDGKQITEAAPYAEVAQEDYKRCGMFQVGKLTYSYEIRKMPELQTTPSN